MPLVGKGHTRLVLAIGKFCKGFDPLDLCSLK